jgi:type IV pilus assembly protein PilA
MKWILSKKMKFSKNQKGLTLIELLAVIVILGVIAAIAVPAIGSTITNSKTKADAQTVLLIQAAAERYAMDINPNGLASTALLSTATSISMLTLKNAGYLKEIPDKQSANPPTPYTTVAVSYVNGWIIGAVSP